jgi:hypothetical protein
MKKEGRAVMKKKDNEEKRRPQAAHPLVDRWFHSFGEEGVVHWQGHILAEVSPEVFLVQLYEWLGGEPSVQKLVPLIAMAGWDFYDTDKDMNYTYRYTHRPRLDRRDRERARQLTEGAVQ